MDFVLACKNVGCAMQEHSSDISNLRRAGALLVFKIVEQSAQIFPYVSPLKTLPSLAASELLFLAMDQTFKLYDYENRKSLNKMKDSHETKIHQTIRTYMSKGDMLTTKERLKQYIPLTIRNDIACQSLIGNAIDAILLTIKTLLIHKRNKWQMALLVAGMSYSFVETLDELNETATLNRDVTIQTQLHNQRCHDMISCYLNVAENKGLDGKFRDDECIKDILVGLDEYTKKTLNDSPLSNKRNNRFYRQQRLVNTMMFVFKDASVLNSLYEANRLTNGIMYALYNINENRNALKELRMDEVKMVGNRNTRNIVDWTRMGNQDVPLYTIKKFRFSYPTSDAVVLKNDFDNIHIKQNCWLQIRGPSGAGKSTLIKLFLKTIDMPNPEAFLFMKHANYDFISIREFVSTNSVGNGLFYESVDFNVYYSINHRDDNVVQHYFTLFGIGSFEAERNKNINMMSSGQQQKIKVIRIILLILQRLYDEKGRHKQIFFLDEPTANMDPLSETHVLNELKRLREAFKLSFVFVSHSVAASQFADEYLIIGDDGQLRIESKQKEDEIIIVAGDESDKHSDETVE